ncbi:MAG: hypothetical protein KGJ07_07025, partial [Patescibacteria group bacterium]|nr:hypothetical protein [Patescibacteria group bacterium]
VPHKEVTIMPGSDENDDGTVWPHRKPQKPRKEPEVTSHDTLEDVLNDHTFIHFGILGEYGRMHDEGLEHFGFQGAQLVKEIRLAGKPIAPKLQADLLVRFIMTKAHENGQNPIQYISMYQMDHMTWQMAEAGYVEGSERLNAWQELMRMDKEGLQPVRRKSRAQSIRRIPIDPTPSSLPIPQITAHPNIHP